MIPGPAPDFGALGMVVGHATDDDGATGLTIVRGEGRHPPADARGRQQARVSVA